MVGMEETTRVEAKYQSNNENIGISNAKLTVHCYFVDVSLFIFNSSLTNVCLFCCKLEFIELEFNYDIKCVFIQKRNCLYKIWLFTQQ